MVSEGNFVPPSLENDSKVTRLDAKSYSSQLRQAFCIGTGTLTANHPYLIDMRDQSGNHPVPNGGYVASIFMKVASEHLSARNQPDTLTAHWQFLNRTQAGSAVLVVEEAKLGRGMSVLHITLYQDHLLSEHPWVSASSNKAVVAYMTSGLLEGETGVTLPTGWGLSYQPPPAELARLTTGEDRNWERLHIPLMAKVPVMNNLEYYVSRAGRPLPATHDYWIRLANGEFFTRASLGYVVDAGPPLLVESYRPASRDAPVSEGGFPYHKGFWYPTVTMSIDVKKNLPDAGVEWLRLRVDAKMIQNGRYDAEQLVFDSQGALVALSHHFAMAVDIARNQAKRTSKA